MNKAQHPHKKLVRKLVIFVLVMCVFAYALVPLYRLVCAKTGVNGKTAGPSPVAKTIDMSREITVEFMATRNAQLPWQFRPMVESVRIHPGENKRVTFFASNDSSQTMVVQAIPSVSPGEAAFYLKKTECFCFTQQTLASGQSLEMPVLFHIDENIPKDINTITLSYTLYDAGEFAKQKPNPKAGHLL